MHPLLQNDWAKQERSEYNTDKDYFLAKAEDAIDEQNSNAQGYAEAAGVSDAIFKAMMIRGAVMSALAGMYSGDLDGFADAAKLSKQQRKMLSFLSLEPMIRNGSFEMLECVMDDLNLGKGEQKTLLLECLNNGIKLCNENDGNYWGDQGWRQEMVEYLEGRISEITNKNTLIERMQ